MNGRALWEAEAHRTFAHSLLVALREAFPSVPWLAARTVSSIRSSSTPTCAALGLHLQLVVRHLRAEIEALGGPLSPGERQAFLAACRRAWHRAHDETLGLLAGDPLPAVVHAVAFPDHA